jgi:predicted NACHT family NTPase
MSIDLSEKAAENVIKQLTDKTFSLMGFTVEEIKYLKKSGIDSFIHQQGKRFEKTKTILRGVMPVNFYDIYYPLCLDTFNLSHKNFKQDTESPSKLFGNNSNIVVIGDAGSGKSTLSKHLFLSCINQSYKIPIFVELRNIRLEDTDKPFKNYLTRLILFNEVTTSERIFNRMLKSGKFVFFLDGFDEISGNHKALVIEEIDNFVTKFNENDYFLTSRPYSNVEMLPSFSSFKISDLSYNEGDVHNFVRLQLKDDIEFANVLLKSLQESQIKYVDSFLKNPLLLSLFILTFQSNPTVPEQRYIFYRRVINVLFSEHDSKSKFGYKREWETGLNQEDFEKVLKAFSCKSFMDGVYSFHFDDLFIRLNVLQENYKDIDFSINSFIHDMKVSISLWIEDGGVITFAHRSLQEYFAALFIKNLKPKANKKKVYENLAAPSSTRKITEIRNFVSLCEEMDKEDFNELFLVPSLEEFLKEVDESNLHRTILRIFVDGIVKKDGNSGSISFNLFAVFNDNSSKYQYFSVPIIELLSSMVQRVDGPVLFRTAKLERDYYLGGYARYNFETYPDLEDALVQCLKSEDSNNSIVHSYNKIKQLIEERKSLINNEALETESMMGLLGV